MILFSVLLPGAKFHLQITFLTKQAKEKLAKLQRNSSLTNRIAVNSLFGSQAWISDRFMKRTFRNFKSTPLILALSIAYELLI